jgi:hypothetical protein
MKYDFTGAGLGLRSRFYSISAIALLGVAGCSLFVTRPVQEMSDTNAAIKAAKEVQADVKSPELYRQANEWFLRAKAEYKLKNFDIALDDARKARHFAEEAEFEVIKNGGTRGDDQQPIDQSAQAQPASQGPPPDQNDYATPTGTPATDFPTNNPQQLQPQETTGGGMPSPVPNITPNPAPAPTSTGMPPVNQFN